MPNSYYDMQNSYYDPPATGYQSSEIIVEPLYEPVGLDEAKRWLRVDNDYSDEVIKLLIKAMRRYAENRTFRAFIPRTYRLSLYGSGQWYVRPCSTIVLPMSPAISVEQITYVDMTGTRSVLDPASYELRKVTPPVIVPAYLSLSYSYLSSWRGPVEIDYVAGYAAVGSPDDEVAAQAAVPSDLRVWMEMRIATLFENREHLVVGASTVPLPFDFADGLLDDLIVGTRLF